MNNPLSNAHERMAAPQWVTWMLTIFSGAIIVMLSFVMTSLGDLREFKGTMTTQQTQLNSLQAQQAATEGQVVGLEGEVTTLLNRYMADSAARNNSGGHK